MKTCKQCGETKADRHFSANNDGRLRSKCKPCYSQSQLHRHRYGALTDPLEKQIDKQSQAEHNSLFFLPESAVARRQMRIAQHAARVASGEEL
jgi:hypothetical protein